MPRIDDHPLRLARVRAGVGQIALAREAGINRSTISSIEENRTVSPAPETLSAIERVLNIPQGSLETALAQWHISRKLQGP